MSAPAFTPWTASVEKRPAPASGHWYVVLDEDENGLGEFYGEDHDANVANLHLAAAAPELYEALDDILVHCLADIEGEEQSATRNEAALTIYRARRDKAQAALAKARGETA